VENSIVPRARSYLVVAVAAAAAAAAATTAMSRGSHP